MVNINLVNRIPDDWEEIKLEGVFVSLVAGVSVNSDESKYSPLYVLKTSAVSGGKFYPNQKKPVVFSDIKRVKCPVIGDSLIISRMNTPQLVGECGYVEKDICNCFLPDRLWLASNRKTREYDFRWLSYILSYGIYRDSIRAAGTGTSNSMKNISKENLLNIMIPKPSLEEQNEISGILQDIDELLLNLEKLITKKKAILEGAMQELLTEKRKLPGIDNSEIEYKIGEIGIFYSGLSGKTKTDFGKGNAQYITFLNVLTNAIIDISILESVNVEDEDSQNEARRGDLFFNTSSETPEEVGMCSVLLDDVRDVYLNSFCFGYRLKNKDIDPLFFSYYFNSCEGRKIMSVLAQGATRYNLSKSYFSETTVNFPKHEKQKAIAQILFDMDSEIESLQQKLEKYRQIKSGMMDELLTGKVRLV